MTSKYANDVSLNKNEYLSVLAGLVGDGYWRCSILELTNFYAKKNKVFVYAFDHRLSNSPWPVKIVYYCIKEKHKPDNKRICFYLYTKGNNY